MISVVFVLAVLNLLLGFALAVVLERQVVVPVPWLRSPDHTSESETIFEIPVARVEESHDVREHLPERWLALLGDRAATFATLVEATVEVLRLDVGTYHGDLLDIEDLVRSAIAKGKPEAVRDAIQVLVALNEEWMDRQNDALKVLAAGEGMVGEHAAIRARMETMLTDQVGLIEECCAELLSVDVRHDTAAVAITESLGQLMSMGHRLRDAIAQATVEIVYRDGQLSETDPQCRRDEQTGLQNRLGVEWTLDNWARDDARREHALAAVLVDIDRFGALNSRVGTRVGERLLLSLAGFLQRLASGEEPKRPLYRYGGQSFFLAYDDCVPQDLLPRVEKIRQAVAAAQLDHDGELYSLTVRCAIAQIGCEEGAEAFCRRLEGLVQVAREAGGNCICLEGAAGAGPAIIRPEPVTVEGQVIKVE